MNNEEIEDRFIQQLLALRNEDGPAEVKTDDLREQILRVGSATPDNIACADRIEVGVVPRRAGPREIRGVKLVGRAFLVADVLNAAEDGTVPKAVLDAYPDLTEEEWLACLRFAVLVLMGFEKKSWSDEAAP